MYSVYMLLLFCRPTRVNQTYCTSCYCATVIIIIIVHLKADQMCASCRALSSRWWTILSDCATGKTFDDEMQHGSVKSLFSSRHSSQAVCAVSCFAVIGLALLVFISKKKDVRPFFFFYYVETNT